MGEIDEGVMEGYLLLADISGYTTFLTGTELEHSHAIVTELTKLIRATLSPPMQFVKLEGDAVFCFAPQAAFPSGELLVELVESCYFDFTNRLLNMTRSTTCTCDACRAIGGLDLKFVVHNGTFIVDRDEDGRLDLAGPDVILVHRLLKNTIIEQGGPSSYGFFTDPCLTGVSTEFRLPAHEESIESFAQVTGVVQDLAAVAAQRREAQVVRLTDDDADVVFSYIVDAPPAVCWQYFVEPGKRLPSHCRLSRRESSSRRTARVGSRRERRAIVLTASAAMVSGSISTGDPTNTSPAISPELKPRVSSTRSSTAWKRTSSSTSGTAAPSTGGCSARTTALPKGSAPSKSPLHFSSEISTHPTWGDQMRRPIAEDAAMYGLDRPVG